MSHPFAEPPHAATVRTFFMDDAETNLIIHNEHHTLRSDRDRSSRLKNYGIPNKYWQYFGVTPFIETDQLHVISSSFR